MKRWQGFSPHLATPRDLMSKLERDLARLVERPDNDDAAWDFFVTADHMRDWTRDWTTTPPGPIRPANTNLLKTVRHLANGGKHFQTDPSRQHDSVADLRKMGAFQSDAFQKDAFASSGITVSVRRAASTAVRLAHGRVGSPAGHSTEWTAPMTQ